MADDPKLHPLDQEMLEINRRRDKRADEQDHWMRSFLLARESVVNNQHRELISTLRIFIGVLIGIAIMFAFIGGQLVKAVIGK